MLDYVKEAPEVARKNIQRYQELVDPLLSLMQKREYRSIWLVASGSSYNACFAARPFMRKVLKKEVKIITPYTFTYYFILFSFSYSLLFFSRKEVSL